MYEILVGVSEMAFLASCQVIKSVLVQEDPTLRITSLVLKSTGSGMELGCPGCSVTYDVPPEASFF